MQWQTFVAWLSQPKVLGGALLLAVALVGLSFFVSNDAPPPIDRADPVLEDGHRSQGPDDAQGLYQDTDGDGVSDLLENYVFGSAVDDPFTLGGEIPDGWLARFGYNPSVPGVESRTAAYPGPREAPAAFGPDGLPHTFRMTLREVYLWNRPTDWNESASGPWDNGLDPRTWDNGAGIPFSWLIHFDLNPFNTSVAEEVLAPEPDGDGLSVRESYETATNPLVVDTDGDGLSDDVELEEVGTDPARFDTAGHGVADGWAVVHGLDPTDPQMPLRDPDRDGLANKDEFNRSVDLHGLETVLAGGGLDPNDATSGDARIPDGWLVAQGLDPLTPGVDRTVLQRSTDYGPARERGVASVELTVWDAYAWQRPEAWNEAARGPWMGGLKASTNDTDGDGLPDAVEIAGWTINTTLGAGSSGAFNLSRVDSDPGRPDTDLDGLLDGAEFLGRFETLDGVVHAPPTDPRGRDTDFDGLTDAVEVLEIPQRAREAGLEGSPLDPTIRDSDADGLSDGEEYGYWTRRSARYASGATEYEFDHRTSDGVAVLGDMPGASPPPGLPSPRSVAAGLAPWGDMDGDGLINLLDPDSDGDDLQDGWEVAPSNYAMSPFAAEHPRPTTDPANDDTDGDRLQDGWEVRFGTWDEELGGWNLDPSTWSSFGDDIPDSDKDLDGDGITWYTFHLSAVGYDRQEHTFATTNLVEHDHGTHPNEASTTGNGLLDGWTVFWGRVYPELGADAVGDLYPGAPGPLLIPPGVSRPSPEEDVDATTDRANRVRFGLSQRPGENEVLEAVFQNVQDASTGKTRDVFRFRAQVDFTFQSEQSRGTNPYLVDTDGDGAPDAWEAAYAGAGGPDPVAFQREEDHDGDDLPLFKEYTAGTDPLASDTDLGGVPDGEETGAQATTDPLNPLDDARLRDPSVDTDGDGLSDAEEVHGWEHPTLGPLRTDPKDADTDGDGLADGNHLEIDPSNPDGEARIQRLEESGLLGRPIEDGALVRFLGEADWGGDPRRFSTPGDGTPDGWRALWNVGPGARDRPYADMYAHARPPWWDEAGMGPWWWGLDPRPGADADGDDAQDARVVGGELRVLDRDLDEDGLDDLSGEDPTPAARPEHRPPRGFPHATASEAGMRARAAAFGVPPWIRSDAGDWDGDGDGVPDALDRVQVALETPQLHAPTRDGAPALVIDGGYAVTGWIVTSDTSHAPEPVPNATLAIHVSRLGNPVGYGVTDSNGRFNATFTLAASHRARELPPSGAFQGRVLEPVEWTTNLTLLGLGRGPETTPNALLLQVLNTSGAARPGDPTHLDLPATVHRPDGSTVKTRVQGIHGLLGDRIPFTLLTDSRLNLQAPDHVLTGEPLDIEVTLLDGRGTPIPNAPLSIDVGPEHLETRTDAQGRAELARGNRTGGVGKVPIHIAYPGTDYIGASAASHTVSVRHATELRLTTLEPLPALPGQAIHLTGQLDTNGDAGGADIHLSLGNVTARTTADEAGSFEASIDLPERIPDGDFVLTLTFQGTPVLAPSRLSQPLPVKQSPHIGLASTSAVLHPTDRGELVVTVTAPGGGSLPSTLRIRGLPGEHPVRTVETGEDGSATVEWTTGRTLGAHVVSVSRQGDAAYLPATNETTLTVVAPTRLTAGVVDLFRGHPAELFGRLETRDGVGIAGGSISLAIQNETVSQTVTDEDGSFRLTWTLRPTRSLGSTALHVSFEPSDGDPWEPALRVLHAPVRAAVLAQPLADHVLLEDPRVQIALSMDNGEPVDAGTAEISVPDLGVGASTAVEQGVATFELPLPRDTTPGVYGATVSLADNPDLEVPPAPLSLTIATPVTLSIESPGRIGQGQVLGVHGVPVDGRGNPVDAGEVLARLEGGPATRAPVGSGGAQLHVPVPGDLPAGPHELHISWSGPPGYLNTSETLEIEVLEGTVLSATLPPTAEPGTRVEGLLQLARADGAPLAHERILVRETRTNQTLFLSTDEDGRATFMLKTSTLSPTSLTFRYPGDERLAAATATHTVELQPVGSGGGSGTLFLAAAAGVALLAAGGVLWGLRRRRLVGEVARALDQGAARVVSSDEHEAVILHTYHRLVDILSEHSVVPRETQTLREYETEIRRQLGIRTQSLLDLFDVFDETIYGAGLPSGAARARAVDAFWSVSRDLRESLTPSSDEAVEVGSRG